MQTPADKLREVARRAVEVNKHAREHAAKVAEAHRKQTERTEMESAHDANRS